MRKYLGRGQVQSFNGILSEKAGWDFKKMISVTTDGVPTMVGKIKGLVNRLIKNLKVVKI